ncbi:phosphoglycerate mutase family protein [Neobacillus niacini]|uniref:histidine phosphatase family protein n=1 Tax=Neobacillus niacini TaxID=86668 RepID=UPI00285FA5B6|nr:phosphoglycerate mutase family protein [Neobacillus niacini]MDR6997618.1 putative phosphoglycerate mutase [Neobacillus niacini]
MQLTLIRHLPTEWNKKTWLQGRRDIEISQVTEEFQKGIAENQRLLKNLAPFDLVLASTLKRTHQTAHLYGFLPETEVLLDELDFGSFEGLPKEKLMEHKNRLWIENPSGLVLGESLKSLEERIVLFLDKYQDFHNLLLFGHGSWIRALLSYKKYGHINNMNKITVGNNSCITLSI